MLITESVDFCGVFLLPEGELALRKPIPGYRILHFDGNSSIVLAATIGITIK